MIDYDAIVIGAGHNGLITAAYLAKAGKKVLVLERRSTIGGIAATEEVFPGFKYLTCAHLAGSLAPAVASDLELITHGLEWIRLSPLIFAPTQDGKPLLVPPHPSEIRAAVGRHSKSDAGKIEPFGKLVNKLASLLRSLYDVPLPERADPGHFNLRQLLKVGWRFHRLGAIDMHEFLRIFPMSVADLLNEWFECDLLKAGLAAGGLLGSFVGPRQQGTAFGLLHRQIGETIGAFRGSGFIRGGINQLPQALAHAARRYGAEIRTSTEVATIATKNGAVSGVALKNGEEFSAQLVVSGTDVKNTFLRMVDPGQLDPNFTLQVKNIRARGVAAKLNFALASLPKFNGAPPEAASVALGGIIHIGPAIDYIERAADDAKYGRFSKQPVLEITIPSVLDDSLAPPGKHVMSVWMHYAPYHLRQGDWDRQRDALGDTVTDVIESYAPGFKDSILHRQVLTPLDLERMFGLTGGHVYHAEIALDQIFFMRPLPGWARYGTPIENLFLCGSAAHPGGGITGLPGYFAAREILKRRP